MDDIGKTVYESINEIQIKMMETEEEFIFKTVRPFCKDVVQHKIGKKDLETAIIKHIAQSRIYDHGKWKCPSCQCDVYASQDYCGFCGQHMKSIQGY